MLWKEVLADDDIDIIELVREYSPVAEKELKGFNRGDFSEVYLFFDYDALQTNLPRNCDHVKVIKGIKGMMETFDNETEKGKLYISYPMAEAIRDFKEASCEAFSGSCFTPFGVRYYKRLSGDRNPMAQVNRYTKKDWQTAVLCYRNRLSMLSQKELDLESCKRYTTADLYKEELRMISSQGRIVILSAFPQFFIDYFPLSVIETFFQGRELVCPKSCRIAAGQKDS